MSVCLEHDSDVATEAALRLMPKDATLSLLDCNDPQVFGDYYDLWFTGLVRYVRRLTPVDVAQAEDMVQAAFIRAWGMDLPLLNWRQFRQWIQASVFHSCQIYWRSQRRLHQMMSLDVFGEEEYERPLADDGMSVEDLLVIKERLCEVVAVCQQDVGTHLRLIKVLLEWGYDPHQLVAYMRQHKLFGGRLAVVGDQVAVESEQWACVQCGSTERQQSARGLCRRCYNRQPDRLRQVRHMAMGTCVACGAVERQINTRGLCYLCRRQAPKVVKPAFQCTTCGTTERIHWGRGLCKRCYDQQFGRPVGFCERCGRSERRLARHGVCLSCASREQRRQREVIIQANDCLTGVQPTMFFQCADCGSGERPHRGRGLCRRCYARRYERPVGSCDRCGQSDRRLKHQGLCLTCYSREYEANKRKVA